jgi:hypothetical protein
VSHIDALTPPLLPYTSDYQVDSYDLELLDDPAEYMQHLGATPVVIGAVNYLPSRLLDYSLKVDSLLTPTFPTLDDAVAALSKKKRWTVKQELKETAHAFPEEFQTESLFDKLPTLADFIHRRRGFFDVTNLINLALATAKSVTGDLLYLVSDSDIHALFTNSVVPVFEGIVRPPNLSGFNRQLILAASVAAHRRGFLNIDTTVTASHNDLIDLFAEKYFVYKKLNAKVPHVKHIIGLIKSEKYRSRVFFRPLWSTEKSWGTE